ncbi:hypothetical protein Slu03_12930 [Sediminihabitans luteus]|nr:hypothetical protein Slu03_12930 [Sediminihabitans luteus]
MAAVGRVPRRITVAGVAGAGKSTWSARIGAALDLPYTDVDGLFHGPGWTPRPEFVDDVTALVAQDRWVAEYNFGAARPLLLGRAEVLLWLDLPTWRTMRQVTARTWRRWRTHEVLWNGNVEPRFFSTLRAEENIVVWSWTKRRSLRTLPDDVAAVAPHVVVVRVRSHAQAERWLARLTG